MFKIAEQLFRHFSWEGECILCGADSCWCGISVPLGADRDVSGGLQWTHGVERFDAVVAWSSEEWAPLSWGEPAFTAAYAWLRIHLRIQKQSLEQVTARAGSNVCVFHVGRVAAVAGWLISSSRQVAKVIFLKCILWFVYELAQREAQWEVTWLFHWSSERVIFMLYTSWLHFSMCLVFVSFSICCGILFDWHFQMYSNWDLCSLTSKKKL